MASRLRFWPHLLHPGRLRHLTFWVTGHCNQACLFCFQRGEDTGPPGDELSPKEIARLAPSLGRPLWLLIGGGEPFLRPDLAQVCATLLIASRPAILTLTSNGSQPQVIEEQTRAILRAADRTLVVVKLSLDGVEATHDHLRGRGGSFARVLETHARLRRLALSRANLELGFNSVLCAANRREMPGLVDMVAALPGRPTHTISLARGRLPQPELGAVGPQDYLEAVTCLEARAGRHRFRGAGLKAALDAAQHRLILRSLLERRRPIPCRAGRESLVLTAQGEVLPCELARTSLGNLRQNGYDLGRLLTRPQARSALRSLAASDCWCTHECNAMVNLLSHPPAWPALAMDWLRPGR
jgi:MoaA/NifB/PqqE/SkfB family radical SAM enzyme